MSERDQALAQIVALAEQHSLTHEEVRRALAAGRSETVHPRQGPLGTVFAYLGGTLVLAGLCVFVAIMWGDMNFAERVIVTLGTGLAALVLSYMASLSPARGKMVTPLFLLAVLTEPVGIVVVLREFSAGGDERLGALAVAGIMTLQCLLFFARLRREVVLFFGLLYGSLAATAGLYWVDADDELIALVVGVSIFLISIPISRSKYGTITPLWFFLATVLILGGWFELVDDSLVEFSEVVLIAGFMYLSTVLRSRTLLATSTLALLVYLGYFSGKHFAESVGWPLLLIGLGIAMMALGTVAVRIHRRYIKSPV